MKKHYCLIQFRLSKKNYYIIWYDDDKSGVLLTNDNKILTFSNQKEIFKFAKEHRISAFDEKTTYLNLDKIKTWLNLNKKKPRQDLCSEINTMWNLFSDIASSLKDDSLLNFSDNPKNASVYDKIFAGINLSVMNKSGKKYSPELTKVEKEALKEVFDVLIKVLNTQSDLKNNHESN